MVTLSASGNSIIFAFQDNPHYLQNGTIEVPKNSLTLVTDDSGMATFKKSASNDIFISALYSELGMSKSELETWFKENAVGTMGGDITSGEVQTMIDESISGKQDSSIALTQAEYDALVSGGTVNPDIFYIITDAPVIDISNYYTSAETNSAIAAAVSGKADSVSAVSSAEYVSSSTTINFKNAAGTVISSIDASDFVIDGMIDDVRIETISGASYLVIDFNTASGKEDIQIPLTDIFDPSNYYTKQEVDASLSGKVDTSTFETYSGSVETALSGKQDTLSAGTNITISGNVISAEGGGKAIEAGRGISITTGATADTVSFNLPISAGTGTNSLILGYTSSDSYWRSQANGNGSVASGVRCIANTQYSIAVGYNNTASGGINTYGNFAQGYMTTASGNASHSEGLATSATSEASHSEGHNTTASGNYSHSEGEEVKATNVAEHSQGRYNVSNKASTTWGDSGNTLFSVGNGTASNARHNAFEIRQNGDIYLTLNGQDVKLQDQLGGGEASSAITSGDTNAVAGGAVYDKFDEVESVTAAALNNLNDKFGGLKLQQITQSDYDALVSGGTVDNSTLYIITNVVN